jgi:hypothetical protein
MLPRNGAITMIHKDCGGTVYFDVTCYTDTWRCAKCKAYSNGMPKKVVIAELPNEWKGERTEA